MSAASSLTARLMETWAHTQDIADALGVTREPTARLRHVAHIGVGARAFSYAARGRPCPATPVRVELTAPDGAVWTWGPADAADRVTGPALDFCLLVTQRRHRDDLALAVDGPAARQWMAIAQAFAGPRAGRSAGPAHAGEDPMTRPVRIANCSGFYGDRFSAAREMLDGRPDRRADRRLPRRAHHAHPVEGPPQGPRPRLRHHLPAPDGGRARHLPGARHQGRRQRRRPQPGGPGRQDHRAGQRLGLRARVAYLTGDDLAPAIGDLQAAGHEFTNLDTGLPLAKADLPVVTANAYLGGWGIAAALQAGADIVICRRVTDASLVVGPAAWWHGWARDDWDALAGAVAAGHVIECGPQATGGNYSFLDEITDRRYPGFPIAEVAADGSSVITKHDGTGGLVSVGTVTAQLLYEIGDPAYLNPDVVAHFDTIRLEQAGPDRVALTGTRGSPPPDTLKVALNMLGGYRNTMTMVLTGLDIEAKAEHATSLLFELLGGPASSRRWTSGCCASTARTRRPTSWPPRTCASPSRTRTSARWAGRSPTRSPSWPWPATPGSTPPPRPPRPAPTASTGPRSSRRALVTQHGAPARRKHRDVRHTDRSRDRAPAAFPARPPPAAPAPGPAARRSQAAAPRRRPARAAVRRAVGRQGRQRERGPVGGQPRAPTPGCAGTSPSGRFRELLTEAADLRSTATSCRTCWPSTSSSTACSPPACPPPPAPTPRPRAWGSTCARGSSPSPRTCSLTDPRRQAGGRFSRNARIPSCASSLPNSRADSAAISGPSASSRSPPGAVSSCLVSAAPCGEVSRICATSPSTTPSSSSPAQADRDQAQPRRHLRPERLAGQVIAHGLARIHDVQRGQRDHRRGQADPRLGERERRVLRRDGQVARAHDAHAARPHVPGDPGDDRLGQLHDQPAAGP